MIRKITVIPILLLITFCGESYQTVTDRALERGAAVKLSSFYRQQISIDGKKEWEVNAKEAYIFSEKDADSRIVIYNFSFKQYDDAGKTQAHIRAVRGEIDYQEENLYLTGSVKFKNDKRRVYSEKMRFNWGTKILTSDASVKLYENGLYTHCRRGIKVEQELNRQTCKGAVGVSSSTPGGNGGSGGGGLDNIFQ